jgi:hypothetical protein
VGLAELAEVASGGGGGKEPLTIQEQMTRDANRARRIENRRIQRINKGEKRIDKIFGKFDKGFYKTYQNKYVNFYQPEIDDQFGDAQDELTYALARAGTLKSSIAGGKQADLRSAYKTQQAVTLSQAQDATSALRGNINNEKSGLISLLNATGDANRASNEALSRSQQLFREAPAYDPLGDIFAGVASGVGSYYAGQQERDAYDAYFGGRAPSSGSSRVVT